MSIKTNTTDLQALLEVANNLPVAENLDTELSTQDTLIANIMTALEGKTAGGGGSTSTPAPFNDVNFRDYDGTILYSYTKEEALALTAMPELPTQEGLTCQGWNWSLENMQSYVGKYGKCEIGATYITDDGKTRIYITLQEGRTSPMLGVCPNGTVTVDWGDGTTPDTLTGIITYNIVQWTPTHHYAAAGDYVITLTVDGEMGFYGENSTNKNSCILRYSSSADTKNSHYRNSVKKIEIGSNVTRIYDHSFMNCYNLSYVTIPNNVINFGQRAFGSCYSLTHVNIPNSITNIGYGAFHSCSGLLHVVLPDSVTNIDSNMLCDAWRLQNMCIPDGVTTLNTYMFGGCNILSNIVIPDGITSIGNTVFYNCYIITSFVIPSSVTLIGDYAFRDCYGLAKIRFNSASPPSITGSGAFSGVPTDCIISVPTGSLSAYTSATNYPSSSTYTYIEED